MNKPLVKNTSGFISLFCINIGIYPYILIIMCIFIIYIRIIAFMLQNLCNMLY